MAADMPQRRQRAMTAQPHGITASRWCGGVAAVEFALVAPLLLTLLTGIGEIGIAAHQKMQVQAAVEAGALYAARHGAADGAALTAIGNAVVNGTGTYGISAVPAPTSFYGCPKTSGDPGIVSQGTNSTTVCAGDSKLPGQYVTVNAKITHTTLLPYLHLSLTTLSASATVRVK
jgi:Flp pilus assembly protein TadG